MSTIERVGCHLWGVDAIQGRYTSTNLRTVRCEHLDVIILVLEAIPTYSIGSVPLSYGHLRGGVGSHSRHSARWRELVAPHPQWLSPAHRHGAIAGRTRGFRGLLTD